MNPYHLRVLISCLFCFLMWGACSTPTGPATDSESHFLSPCDSDGDCPGDYQCICSLCTKSCTSADDCAFDSYSVACVDPSASPFDTVCSVDTDVPDGVCLLDCDIDSDCSVLGSRYICESSVCVAASISGDYFNLPDTGTSDATSADWGDDLDVLSVDQAIDSSDMTAEVTADVTVDSTDAFEDASPPPPQCAPMDAVFTVDECDRFWGYLFDGVGCEEIVGYCECTGDDCESLYETEEECTEATATCGFTDIEFDLDTDVGFTGMGTTDVHLHSGDVDVFDPFHDPTDCSKRVTATQRDRLLTAAARVDWADVESSYIRPENPDCCCDQFTHDFTIELTAVSGSTVRVQTEWCDESTMDDLMPAAFLEFIGEVNHVGLDVLATCGPIPEDCEAAETADAFLSVEELDDAIEADGPGEYWVEALMFADDATCNASCDCSILVGPKSHRYFFALALPTDDRIQGCFASDCEFFGYCDTPYPGEWARLQLDGPTGESGVMNVLSRCPVESTPRPDATLLWQAPAGFAGTGPAIEVTSGQIRLWETASYTPPDDLEPDAVITTSTQATDELFERWARIDVSSLPHDPDEPGNDCYPTVAVRLCSDCDETVVDYRIPTQLTPEMDEVFEWFDAILGVASDIPANPSNWCVF